MTTSERTTYLVTINRILKDGKLLTEQKALPVSYTKAQAEAIAKAYKSLPDVGTVILEEKIVITQTKTTMLNVY